MDTDNICIAKLGKAVGLNGDLRLFLDTDFPEQFKEGVSFSTNKNLILKIIYYNQKRNLVRFENYENIDLAKKLTNQQLFTSYEKTKENCILGANEFFWFDLMDCRIVEDDKTLGYVVDIHRYPSSDYLEIKTDDGLIEIGLPKVFLLPHIFNKYVIDIDLINKIIKTKNAYEILENS